MYNKTKMLQSNILLRRLYNAYKTYGEEIKAQRVNSLHSLLLYDSSSNYLRVSSPNLQVVLDLLIMIF